ncbi:hypothetical protein MA20_45505 [Bradyrhizobium japonicum]|uniref:Uncharacterized protein n=1 Tax=Bradyrhizobium japonicum TaxID=375 RepID=A0A0A3XFP4_BRAJP|nr:hypothetical protein MA20_45505 [Bradyrhizobium japonicum]
MATFAALALVGNRWQLGASQLHDDGTKVADTHMMILHQAPHFSAPAKLGLARTKRKLRDARERREMKSRALVAGSYT